MAMKVAVPLLGGPGWMGGTVYVQNLARANASLPESERMDIRLVVFPHTLDTLPLYESILPLAGGVIFSNMDIHRLPLLEGMEVSQSKVRERIFEQVDVFFPMDGNSGWDFFVDRPVGVWIPDLQHLRHPEFFPAEEAERRNRSYGLIARKAGLVVFSSEAAMRDFDSHYPESAARRRVIHFASTAPREWFEREPDGVRRRYGLPERYLLCCNQFWKHKDHLSALRALAILKERGVEVPLVCTGQTSDPRFPDHFGFLQDEIGRLGLERQVSILGLIDRTDQIQLARSAMAIVQPSLFEGWSTVVEDARLLGKDMFLSDIDVHLEQAPPHGRYFRQGDAGSLADVLEAALPELLPGPDVQREQEAAERARAAVAGFGRAVRDTLKDALRDVFHRS